MTAFGNNIGIIILLGVIILALVLRVLVIRGRVQS